MIINEIIPEQGFEKTRDAIGAILKLELDSQKEKQQFIYPIDVYVGRSTPFHHSEEIMVNVLLDSGNASSIHERGSQDSNNFFIDIYVSSKENSKNIGGYNATKIRDKFIGMCRYILQNHRYKTLNLPLGCIMGTYVTGFENFEPTNSQDSSFVKMSRLSYNVRVSENQKVWDGLEINSIFTKMKLDLTSKGYQCIYEK